MIVIAHHYNNDRQQSFPGLELIREKVGCKKRYAIKLLNVLKERDIFVIEKGRGRGHTTAFGLAPMYTDLIKEMLSSKSAPFPKIKGVQSCAQKGVQACARKGVRPTRENVPQSIKTKEKAAAASAAALPPPPLLPEADPADVAKFQALFEESRGRKLYGAN
jgi:hypothetical protein